MIEIRESQIEDILSTYLDLTKNILSLEGDLSLIGRQKKLPSGGILDLLFLEKNYLHLLELKVEPGKKDFCRQIVGYYNDLQEMQNKDELPKLPIKKYLVCPEFSSTEINFCVDHDVIPITYSPYEILKTYYFRVKAISCLIDLKPNNHGVWNLHLLNRILFCVNVNNGDENNISKKIGLTKSTVNSYFKLASELGLVTLDTPYKLTKLGDVYIKESDGYKPVDYLNDKQVRVLSDFIKQNPFFSPATYGIYISVETIFVLSKNFYPVPFEEARKFFLYLSGKYNEWAVKASKDAFKMYSNYATDLGLLAKSKDYYITPSGIKFILLLELNKSIMFVNSL